MCVTLKAHDIQRNPYQGSALLLTLVSLHVLALSPIKQYFLRRRKGMQYIFSPRYSLLQPLAVSVHLQPLKPQNQDKIYLLLLFSLFRVLILLLTNFLIQNKICFYQLRTLFQIFNRICIWNSIMAENFSVIYTFLCSRKSGWKFISYLIVSCFSTL